MYEEPTGYLSQEALLTYRKVQPALVDDVLGYAISRTMSVMRGLGVETEDAGYFRAHVQAALYRAADALVGELCEERARSYKRQDKRKTMDEVTADARATYGKLVR